MAAEPRLLLVAPFPVTTTTEEAVTQTTIAAVTEGGVMIPRDYLMELSPHIFVQLAAVLTSAVAQVIELAVALEREDSSLVTLAGTTIRYAATAATPIQKQLGRAIEVTTAIRRFPLPTFRLVGRVSGGTGRFMAPTLLFLRRPA